MAIQTNNITLDGRTYTLDERDRVAAQLVAENDNTFTGNITYQGHGVRHTSFKKVGRYYLDEDFEQRPCLNASITSATEATREPANRNFEVIDGASNLADSDISFTADRGGITLSTSDADEDQAILLPHLDTNQSAWTGTKWGTENEVIWEASVSTNDIDNGKWWAGLKLTNDSLAITDANSVWFLAATDATNGQTLSTTDNTAMAVDGTGMAWHCIYSVGDVFYTTNLGLAVAADTTYHFKIMIDSSRQASVYINGSQYGLVNSSGHGTGITFAGTDNGAWGSTNTIVNGASGGSTSTSELTLVVDGTDARTTFKPGDYVHVVDTAVPIGKVKSVTALAIVLETLDASIDNDVELFNYGQAATSHTQKSLALTDDIDLIPYIGIEGGDANTLDLDVHWCSISRKIYE